MRWVEGLRRGWVRGAVWQPERGEMQRAFDSGSRMNARLIAQHGRRRGVRPGGGEWWGVGAVAAVMYVRVGPKVCHVSVCRAPVVWVWSVQKR